MFRTFGSQDLYKFLLGGRRLLLRFHNTAGELGKGSLARKAWGCCEHFPAASGLGKPSWCFWLSLLCRVWQPLEQAWAASSRRLLSRSRLFLELTALGLEAPPGPELCKPELGEDTRPANHVPPRPAAGNGMGPSTGMCPLYTRPQLLTPSVTWGHTHFPQSRQQSCCAGTAAPGVALAAGA